MIQVIREFIDKNTGKFMRVGAIMSNETTQRENELVSKGFAKKLKEEKTIEPKKEEVVEEVIDKVEKEVIEEIEEVKQEEVKEVKPKTTKKKVVD